MVVVGNLGTVFSDVMRLVEITASMPEACNSSCQGGAERLIICGTFSHEAEEGGGGHMR